MHLHSTQAAQRSALVHHVKVSAPTYILRSERCNIPLRSDVTNTDATDLSAKGGAT